MTDALNPTVPAGWYPDPWGAPEPRWWDGYAWTENTQATPVEAPAPAIEHEHSHRAAPAHSEPQPATDADSPFPSRRTLRKQGAATGTIPTVGAEEFVLAEPISAASQPPPSPEAEPMAAFAEPAPIFAAESSMRAVSIAEPLPPFTSTPEFTPEPVSPLPPPVWTEADQAEVDAASAAMNPAAEPPATAMEPAEVPAVTDPAASAEVSSAPVPADTDGWAASLSKWDDVEPTTAPPDAPPIFGDAPPISYSQRTVKYQPLHGRTSAVWFIVLMPLLHAAAVLGSVFLFPGVLSFSGSVPALIPTDANLAAIRDWTLFAAAPLALAFSVFTLVMGFQDRTRLRLLGHNQTASPWWLLLHPLVYLIVRSVRVRQSTGSKGSGPLTTYICLYIAPAIAIGIATVVVSALDGAIPS